jgi:hypothetical protein
MRNELKPGDRFKHANNTTDWFIWEVTITGSARIIDGKSIFPIGHEWDDPLQFDDEYLGNFSKSNNFHTIYDILNDTETSER